MENEENGVPAVTSEDDFELCWKKETTVGTGRNATSTEEYVLLDDSKTMKQQGLLNWSVVYIRFRDDSGMFSQYSRTLTVALHGFQFVIPSYPGTLLDVNVQEPSLDDDEEDEEAPSQKPPADPKGKGRAI